MEKINRFNIRVYGILIINDALLLLRENYAGKKLIKFPGGGLEFGEGLIAGLKREFEEELNLNITETKHFYTQDFFVQSLFKPNEQIQTMYYKVQVSNLEELKAKDSGIQEIIWLPKAQWNSFEMPLPVDKIVLKMLAKGI